MRQCKGCTAFAQATQGATFLKSKAAAPVQRKKKVSRREKLPVFVITSSDETSPILLKSISEGLQGQRSTKFRYIVINDLVIEE